MNDRTQSYAQRMADQRTQVATIADTLDKQSEKYLNLLPKDVTWQDFRNTFLIAVQTNYRLLEADRQSLFLGLQKCAASGLKPDGQEAALVVFGDDQEDDEGNVIQSTAKGKKKVVFMPMADGLTKLIRNTGNVKSVRAKVIYRGESVVITDEDGHETYRHVRAIDADTQIDEDPANIIGAYAVVEYKDGGYDAEFMSRRQIDRVRAVSKAKKASAPWGMWFDQMAKKTPLRRLSKRVEKSATNMRFHTAIATDETLTIDEQAEEIRGEFSADKQQTIGRTPQQATGASKSGAERQAETTPSSSSAGEARSPGDGSGVGSAGTGTPPVELWPVDEFGDPIDQPEPMSAMEFAAWFESALFRSKNPNALYQNNADNLKDAETDPAAHAGISDAVSRHQKREAEVQAKQVKQTNRPSKAAEDTRPWGYLENGVFRPLPKQPMIDAGMGPPPFDVTLPGGAVRHVIYEPAAGTAEKPKRQPVEIPKTPQGKPNVPGWGAALKADLATCNSEAEIEEWIAINKPNYQNKATEIAVDNWIRDRRKALQPPIEDGPTEASILRAIELEASVLDSEATFKEWWTSRPTTDCLQSLAGRNPEVYSKALEIIDNRRLALEGGE